MGWRFRKSISIGPFRVNLSKSGVGYSVGGSGFRTGVRASGRRYSSVGIPGTGLSYQKEHGGGGGAGRAGGSGKAGGKAGCLLAAAALLGGVGLAAVGRRWV